VRNREQDDNHPLVLVRAREKEKGDLSGKRKGKKQKKRALQLDIGGY